MGEKAIGFYKKDIGFSIIGQTRNGKAIWKNITVNETDLVPVVTVNFVEKWVDANIKFGDIDALSLLNAIRKQGEKK